MNTRHYPSWPRRLPKTLICSEAPLYDILEISARRYPGHTAINYYGNKISYEQLWTESCRLAGALADMGVKKGDRVAVYMQNSPQFIISFFGILRANAVVVPLNPMLMISYTAGSTGIPKGCMHTHRTVGANTVSSFHWMDFTAATVSLCVLPLFHVTGLINSLLAPMFGGGTLVLLTRWDRTAALDAIETLGCNCVVAISTMIVDLLAAPDAASRNLSSLWAVAGGGAPLPPAVGEKLKSLTGLTYVEGYGMTETISQTHFNPPDRAKLGSIGVPDFGVDARIIDVDDGGELPPDQEVDRVIKYAKDFVENSRLTRKVSRSSTGPRSSKATGTNPGKPTNLLWNLMANSFSAPVISAAWTRTAIFSSWTDASE